RPAAPANAPPSLFLFWLAGGAVTFGHSGSGFIKCRLRVRDIRNHLGQLKVVVFSCLSGLGHLMTIPDKQAAHNETQDRECGDYSGEDVARIRRPRAHYRRAAIAT